MQSLFHFGKNFFHGPGDLVLLCVPVVLDATRDISNDVGEGRELDSELLIMSCGSGLELGTRTKDLFYPF